MLVFGGGSGATSGTGGRYHPPSDTWTPMSTTGAPSASTPIAAWTGQRLLVHGASGGGAYDPAADAWTPLPAPSLPSGTAVGASVWTGSEWLIFGRNHGHYTDVIRYVP